MIPDAGSRHSGTVKNRLHRPCFDPPGHCHWAGNKTVMLLRAVKSETRRAGDYPSFREHRLKRSVLIVSADLRYRA